LLDTNKGIFKSTKFIHLQKIISWFPKLPSYQTFSYRLNLLTGAFQALVNKLISSFKPEDCSKLFSIVDSMAIITSGGKNRTGKVASEITAKVFVRLKICIIMDAKSIQCQVLDSVKFLFLKV